MLLFGPCKYQTFTSRLENIRGRSGDTVYKIAIALSSMRPLIYSNVQLYLSAIAYLMWLSYPVDKSSNLSMRIKGPFVSLSISFLSVRITLFYLKIVIAV